METTTDSAPTAFDHLSSNKLPVLSAAQARVLGTLMEKARTVPDSYPLTLNAVVTGCNQKSSRNPYMEITENEAQSALQALKAMSVQAGQMLVREVSGSRSMRYEHNFQRCLGVPEQSAVILGILMLRGPQTAGELRINSDRWYKFADISSVEAFLDEMQNRPSEKGGALVQKLPRAPGAREQRWAHLMCGEIDVTELETVYEASDLANSEGSKIHQRISALEDEVAILRQTVLDLCKELGLTAK